MIKFIKIASLFILTLSTFNSTAQFVPIPDANFRTWLNNNGFASCMNGTDMDTTCATIVNATKVNCTSGGISDLTGIEYFDNLDTLIAYNNTGLTTLTKVPATLLHLDCSKTSLTSLPPLPTNLLRLKCSYINTLTALPALPASLQILDCSRSAIQSLPSLPYNLYELYCNNDSLTTLPALPSSLLTLDCSYNDLSTLPTLPMFLYSLNCNGNNLTSLPTLPSSLNNLNCGFNQLTSLPTLPGWIWNLYCSNNQITSLPTIPSSMQMLHCSNNQLTSLPGLSQLTYLDCSYNFITAITSSMPAMLNLNVSNNLISTWPSMSPTISTLNCHRNLLTSLPPLPSILSYLNCAINPITSLQSLPSSLGSLICDSTQITNLPSIPQTLTTLSIGYCQIPVLPELPDTLTTLNISYTPISCLPHIVKVGSLNFVGSNLTCLPNIMQVNFFSPNFPALGLCQPSGNCPTFWNISGNIFNDLNSDCINNAEDNLKYIPVRLDSSGTLLQEFLTNSNGDFSFRTSNGTYTVSIDTSLLPYDVYCPPAFSHTSVILNANTYDTLANFGLQCKPGYDLQSKNVVPSAPLRPGAQRTIFIDAGDASRFYGSLCTGGVSGSVQAILSGPVSYDSPSPGALTPASVNGDTITWNVSDFALSDPSADFNFNASVSPSATSNDTICFQLIVSPLAGDSDSSNNILTSCYPVVNSFDPNAKYMSPSGAVDTSQYWFTYIIFFQNTGNAPAEDIYLLDTLNSNLDAATFTFLSSSHEVTTQLLPGNVLRFNFANINLPDSTSNEPGSHGNVQFKIKRKPGLPFGTTITNNARIYFDYNPAIITNTVSATLSLPVSINAIEHPQFTIDPNPTTGLIQITSLSPFQTLEMYDLHGKSIMRTNFDEVVSTSQIDISLFANGVYFIKLSGENGISVKKLIKQ